MRGNLKQCVALLTFERRIISPVAAMINAIAIKSTNVPKNIPFAPDSNVVNAVISPLKNKNIQIVLLR